MRRTTIAVAGLVAAAATVTGAGLAAMTAPSTASTSPAAATAAAGDAASDGAANAVLAESATLVSDTRATGADATRAGGAGVVLGGPGLRRAKRACQRLPQVLARATALQQRLAADASTPGSIAALEQRIAAARKAGRSDQVSDLTARLAVRRDIQALLPDRIADLKKVQTTLCPDVAKVEA